MGEEEFATACHAAEQQPLLQFRQVPFLRFPDAWVRFVFLSQPSLPLSSPLSPTCCGDMARCKRTAAAAIT